MTTNRKNQRGAATVEYGLVFLIFFTMIYAVMEYGRVVSSYNIIAGATREGARWAIVHGSTSGSPATADQVAAIVKRYCIGIDTNDTTNFTVTTSWPSGNAREQPVIVRTRYTIRPMTGLIFRNSITLASQSRMVISY